MTSGWRLVKLSSRKSCHSGSMYGPGRAQSSGPGSRAGPAGRSRSLQVFGVGKPAGTRFDWPGKPGLGVSVGGGVAGP